MRKTIISDTSCFIVLDSIGEFDLLQKTYDKILTTPEVANILPEWIETRSPLNQSYQQDLELQLDKGEASAITLAVEIKDCTIILDDLKLKRKKPKIGLG